MKKNFYSGDRKVLNLLRKQYSGTPVPKKIIANAGVAKRFKGTAAGLRNAERFQARLYEKYDVVKVEPWGINDIVVIGKKRR